MPRSILRLALVVPSALVAAAGGAAAAHAAPASLLAETRTVFDGTIAAGSGTTAAACHTAYRPGATGVATRSVEVAGPGSINVTLAGERGDWDVAVFDGEGRAIAADASPDAQEAANGFTLHGGMLRLQACRRSGDATAVHATLEHAALRPSALDAKIEAPKLVSVITPTRAQKVQLLALGLDMTEHGGEESLGSSTAPRTRPRCERPACAGGSS